MERIFRYRWTKEDIPKLRKINEDSSLVEKLKQEKSWCEPDEYESLIESSDKGDSTIWNSFRNTVPSDVFWMQNANLSGINLEVTGPLAETNDVNAELSYVHFENAIFRNANLKKVDFHDSYFEHAIMNNSHLENAKFFSANLTNSNLRANFLRSASFEYADLRGTDFAYSDIRGVKFNYAEVGSKGFYTEKQSYKNKEDKIDHIPYESTNFSDVKYNAKNFINRWMFHVFLWSLWFLLFRLTQLYKVKWLPTFRFKRLFSIKLPCKFKIGIGLPWFKKIINVGNHEFPKCDYYLQTKFIGVNTLNVDWSKNPQLKRDIHNQQYLHDLKTRNIKNPLFWILYFLWWVTSDCGDSILRWMLWSGVFAVFFAGLFSGWFTYENGLWDQPKLHYQTRDLLYEKETGKPNPDIAEPDFSESLYYSVVTFTTLGFGDVVPVNASGRWAVMIEVILGYIMLGGLISLFANKFVRRE